MATPRKITDRPTYSGRGPVRAVPKTVWGANILCACDRMEMSLNQLAARAGVARNTLDRMLDGSHETSVQKLAFVAEALGLGLHQIVLPPEQFEEIT
jgi:lambda repressor-like predicted transcriptional regulator